MESSQVSPPGNPSYPHKDDRSINGCFCRVQQTKNNGRLFHYFYNVGLSLQLLKEGWNQQTLVIVGF